MPDSKPRIALIAGPNGAGKTTTAPPLLRDLLGIRKFVNADAIAQGISGFDPDAAAIFAGRAMLNRIHQLADSRQDFAFETTLASRSFAPWISGLQRSGYAFALMSLWLPSPEIAVARVANRVAAGGHDVPAETIRRRYERGLANFFRLYKPLADSWFLYDNSVLGLPKAIARGRWNDEVEVIDETTWNILQARHAKQG